MNIVLAGMPCSGKSTVAGEFKKRGYKVYDTDSEIVKLYGSISGIFEKYGEKYFREIESETVKKLSAVDGAVIATGGGCLLRNDNVKEFKKSGKIVYLKTEIETLCLRAGKGEGRPLLSGDTVGKMKKLYSDRAHIYEQSADITVQADSLSPEEIVTEIINKI